MPKPKLYGINTTTSLITLANSGSEFTPNAALYQIGITVLVAAKRTGQALNQA